MNDDVFTLSWPGRTLRNLVIWKPMNQAVVQLDYGYPQEVTDILVEKVEIIRGTKRGRSSFAAPFAAPKKSCVPFFLPSSPPAWRRSPRGLMRQLSKLF